MKTKLLQLLLIIVPVVLYATEGDSLAIRSIEKDPNMLVERAVSQSFQFPDLDKKFPLKNIANVFDESAFTFENIAKEFGQPSASVYDARSEAEAGFKEIDSTGRWISSFSNEDIQVLPVGIRHKINEVEYQIGFMKATFTKDYTELLVFVKLILPQTKEDGLPVELFFGANNVKLSHQGGIVDGGDLVLLGDIFIPFSGGNWLLLLKGGFDYDSGDVENKTYVTITCDGIEEMQLQGEVQFSRNVVLPLKDGELDPREKIKYRGANKEELQIPNRVKGEFKATAKDWGDMLVEISLTPFVIKGQENRFTFSATKAVFDFSDTRTEGVNFPGIYEEKGWFDPNRESWRGVYVASLEIGLPKAFKSRTDDGQKRVSFEAADLILDSHGVSGSFSVLNLIPLDKGQTSDSNSWAYSVDKMTIELAANHLSGARFNGQLVLPISDEDAEKFQKQQNTDNEGNEGESQQIKPGLAYEGLISEEEFMMSLETIESIDFDVFQAKAQLLPNSTVELKVVDGSFRPKAILNGRMAISASQKESLANEGEKYEALDENSKNEEKTVKFQGIQFQGLEIQTVAPLISVDYFGYSDKVELAGFPVSIANIALNASDAKVQLDFDLVVNLMNASDKGFGADARLGIKGKNKGTDGRQKWKYDGIDLSKMILDANIGTMSLKGELFIREKDSIYGKGFAGNIEATFGGFGPIKSKAIFGKKDFRYWYVDAAVRGLKITTGMMEIEGFAGGAYYKMTRKPGDVQVFSPSGLSYIPSDKTKLGVKAMVFGAIADKKVVSFGAGYEIEFNNNNGVNRMGIYGEAQILKEYKFTNPEAKLRKKLAEMVDNDIVNGIMDSKTGSTFLDKAKEEYKPEIVEGKDGVITAYLGMNFDFVNDSFHATLDAFVDTPGGFIRGVGDNGRAGWGEIYVDKDDWYVYMGIPDNRIGLKMGVGPASVKLDGYFMTGTKIPGSPPPPAVVAEIVGVDATELDYMRDENALGTGRGVAFGTDFSFDTGNVRFLMLYARLRAGLGFDLMMKNYGDARCGNTGDQVGINGWYTNGQAYAYIEGEIGIKIKLFFKKKKIRIFKGGAAVLMQAKLPNPFWMRGYMSGDFDALNGLISGRFRFKVTIGKQCEFENEGPLNGLKMIADVSPVDNESGVDVFTAPQATFSLKVNQPIVIPEDNGDNTYKVVLEEFTVTDEAGKEISGNLDWESSADRVTFVAEDILPPATKLKATVSVSFQEKINGVFQAINEDGKKALETEERTFTTGTAPDHIPLQNIQYAYPVVEQEHFFTEEYTTGYIKLKQGQDYLFDNEQWQSSVKYTGSDGKTVEAILAYNTADNKLQYAIPKTEKSADYKIAITSFSKGNSEENATEDTTTTQQDLGDENIIKVKKNKAQKAFKQGEIERLAYEFSTSEHKTFATKVKDIAVQEDFWGKGSSSDVIFLTSKTKTFEGFDLLELQGNTYTENQALVRAEADLKDAYFTDAIDPMLYQRYPQGSKYSISRNPLIWGFRPKKALPILSSYITSLEHGVDKEGRTTTFPYRYNLVAAYHGDYMDIRGRVINDFVNGLLPVTVSELHIRTEDFAFMWEGRYAIKLQYILPGGVLGSAANYTFKNPVRFKKL